MKVRLLPILIFCAATTLSLKLGSLWLGVDGMLSSSPAVAQERNAKTRAEKQTAGNADASGAGTAKQAAKSGDAKMKDATAAKEGDSGRRRMKTPEERLALFDPTQVTDSELDVLEKLAMRRAKLERREQTLDTRQKLLRATEQRIEAKVAQLKELQQTIARLLKKHDKEKEAKMRSVVKIYEKMKPKDAARIFEELEMRILLDVFERMREDRAAPIMAKMTPVKAKAVTAALAQRRALPKPEKRQPN